MNRHRPTIPPVAADLETVWFREDGPVTTVTLRRDAEILRIVNFTSRMDAEAFARRVQGGRR